MSKIPFDLHHYIIPPMRTLGAQLLAWANAYDRTHASIRIGAIPSQKTWDCLKTYDHCPVCHSVEMEGGHVHIEAGLAFQEIFCQACESSWRDVYVLSGYDDLNFGEDYPQLPRISST